MAERQYATFYIDGNLFGIDIRIIREINRNLDITEVELAPDYIRGLLNLRGQIVTVVDLGTKLGLDARTITERSRIIVLKTIDDMSQHGETTAEKTSRDLVGILADSIGDMVKLDEREIEPPPANIGQIDGKFLSGVVKLDKELLAILRMEEVLAMEELVA